jgi:hypothetical protein
MPVMEDRLEAKLQYPMPYGETFSRQASYMILSAYHVSPESGKLGGAVLWYWSQPNRVLAS